MEVGAQGTEPVIQVVAANESQVIHKHCLRVQHKALVPAKLKYQLPDRQQQKAEGKTHAKTLAPAFSSLSAKHAATLRNANQQLGHLQTTTCISTRAKQPLTHVMTGTSLTPGMSTLTSTPRVAAAVSARMREPLGTT